MDESQDERCSVGQKRIVIRHVYLRSVQTGEEIFEVQFHGSDIGKNESVRVVDTKAAAYAKAGELITLDLATWLSTKPTH